MVLLLACGKTEEIGNKLSADEIAYLRARALRKCRADTNDDYVDFISASNSAMNDLERDEDQWTIKSSASTTTHDIYVWKQTSTAVYFRIVIKETSGANTNVYLKWSKTANNDLMRSAQEDECLKDIYVGSSSSSGSVTLKWEDKTFGVEGDNKFKNTRTFSYSSGLPAVFGLLKYSITKNFYDEDGDSVSTPAAIKETYSITNTSIIAQDDSDDYTNDTYYPNRVYCLVTSADKTGDNTYRKYTSTFTDIVEAGNNGANLTCQNTSDTLDVTVGTVNPETFDPDGELGAPF